MTDDNLRDALQGMRQPQPGIVYIADVLAYVEPELGRLSEERNRALDALVPGNRDLLLAALADAEADRDRARDAAVALEQEAARLREYAERCARSGSRAYAKAGRELLAMLAGGER